MIRLGRLDRLLTTSLALVALAVLLAPTEAHAWGPLAHLNFSAQALQQISSAPPPVRILLADFAHEFLYGSLAADIVVGKNLARYVYHCHNWRVGFNLYRTASPGAEQAFSLGFLAHLAADTVAHNFYVPYKTVGSFHRMRSGHAYWELRYDQRMDQGLVALARRVSHRNFREHDDFLARTLKGSSVIPFGMSRQLFGSLLASARSHSFQRLSRLALAPDRKLPLEDDLVAETNQLAVEAIVGLFREGESCAAAHADATGSRNLRVANDLRRRLFARAGTPELSIGEAHAIARETRESFRQAIHGRLDLPKAAARLAA
ncbi:MAG TPA: zinc dependent phospholipase C family protein [Anaeromyxobacteraceae bacterium]|nr:zinc dependent phospholipase C family protein [Anaeromyxobacteraceae bacterium]